MISNPCIEVQTSCEDRPSVPAWFAEVVLIAQYLTQHDVLETLTQQVHLVRARFGQYEVIDFLVLLFGYAISGERTLQDFFTRLTPFAMPFMALFGRSELPHRSSLSRFLAAVDPSCLEAFRTQFEKTDRGRSGRKTPVEACGIDKDSAMWSSMLTLPGNLPGNEPFPGVSNGLRHDDDGIRSVGQDIWDASEERWCAAGPRSSRCIHVNG